MAFFQLCFTIMQQAIKHRMCPPSQFSFCELPHNILAIIYYLKEGNESLLERTENDFAHSLYNLMVQNNNRLRKSSGLLLFGATSMLVILLSGLVVVLPPFSASATHRLNIPNNLFTPPNQGQSVPKGQLIPQRT